MYTNVIQSYTRKEKVKADGKMADQKLVISPKKYREATTVVSARLPNDMVREIDKVADHTGYNRNEVITLCLEYAIENMEESRS